MFAAGAVLAAIPTVALFQILQRYIVGGLTTGAVKG
jgi:arabinogalactan oligomer/maltooligosaccharide transport system permease protein